LTLSKGSNANPISQISQERITNLYDLMDSAYDAPQIHSFSEKLGHKLIIDHNPRRGEKIYMDPATSSCIFKLIIKSLPLSICHESYIDH